VRRVPAIPGFYVANDACYQGETQMATSSSLSLRRVTTAVGAIIDGVDLREPLAPETVRMVRRALVEHGVIFFQAQDLNKEQFWAFVSQFGAVRLDEARGTENDKPQQIQTVNYQPNKHATAVWHSDTTFLVEPPVGTVLRAVRVPSFGGDTCWSSSYAAYDALSEPMRTLLDGLTAIHSLDPVLGRMAKEHAKAYSAAVESIHAPTAVHPVVLVHPETGRKALFVSEAWTTRIVELSPAESAHVLGMLFEHVKSPDFFMRWHWQANDMAFWDNRAVQHYAVPDYTGERVMERIVLAGQQPRGSRNAHG
jgi:alpha-ketoglutarate-dependent taurine dioxygenase